MAIIFFLLSWLADCIPSGCFYLVFCMPASINVMGYDLFFRCTLSSSKHFSFTLSFLTMVRICLLGCKEHFGDMFGVEELNSKYCFESIGLSNISVSIVESTFFY